MANDRQRIGLVGTGRMGLPMGERLMEAGHALTVWNRSAEKARPLVDAGATLAESPAALADGAEIVVSIVTDATAIDAVYRGSSGLLSGDVTGKLFIEMSTVPPAIQEGLAANVRAKGAAFVECPVGGTVGPAREGKLFGLMGAEAADAARARPVLEQLCRRLEHVGPVGAGATVKLAINLPLAVYWQALGEALAICKPLELEPARLLDIMADTSGATTAVKGRGPAVAACMASGSMPPVAFDIDSVRKDLQAMVAQGKARGIDMHAAQAALAGYEQASADDWGARDMTALPAYWAARAKG